MIKTPLLLLSLLFQTSLWATSFESCLIKVEILKDAGQLKNAGTSVELQSEFKMKEVTKENPPKSCSKMVGQSVNKTIQLKSKQYLPFIKKGNEVMIDYSHFIVDKNDPTLNMEVWKVVFIKTQRQDHDDF